MSLSPTFLNKPFVDIDDIPQYCFDVYQAVLKQPIFDGNGTISKISKVLFLPTYRHARINELATEDLVKKFYKDKKRKRGDPPYTSISIGAFSCGNYFVTEKNSHVTRNGIELSIYKDEIILPEADETLLNQYHSVIDDLKVGWIKSSLEKHPLVFHVEDESEWDLYVSKSKQNDHLIRFLISVLLDSQKDVWCTNVWYKNVTPRIGWHHQEIVYLWIKKTEKERINKILKFELPE